MKLSALQQALEFIGQKLGLKQSEIISPLADKYGGEFIPNQAMAYWLANEQSREEEARRNRLGSTAPQAAPTPTMIPSPTVMPTATSTPTSTPTPAVLSAKTSSNPLQYIIDFIRKNKPEFKGTDAQIIEFYKKYGSKLLPGLPTPTPTPMPRKQSAYEDVLAHVKSGFQKYGNPPISTHSADLAQLGYEVQQKGGDPYLPSILSLKETGGFSYGPAQKINNPFGIGPGISYPDLTTSILGGGPQDQKGLRGVLFNGLYDEYYKSGNLQDVYKHYTPQDVHNNPSYDAQIKTHNNLRSYFD